MRRYFTKKGKPILIAEIKNTSVVFSAVSGNAIHRIGRLKRVEDKLVVERRQLGIKTQEPWIICPPSCARGGLIRITRRLTKSKLKKGSNNSRRLSKV